MLGALSTYFPKPSRAVSIIKQGDPKEEGAGRALEVGVIVRQEGRGGLLAAIMTGPWQRPGSGRAGTTYPSGKKRVRFQSLVNLSRPISARQGLATASSGSGVAGTTVGWGVQMSIARAGATSEQAAELGKARTPPGEVPGAVHSTRYDRGAGQEACAAVCCPQPIGRIAPDAIGK